eukprot:scaffold50438_cov57-Phaeocystis_antarctica.AAC.2
MFGHTQSCRPGQAPWRRPRTRSCRQLSGGSRAAWAAWLAAMVALPRSLPPPAQSPRRPKHPDAHGVPRVALVAAQAPHRLPRSVKHAELAHVGAVHVVVEGHGADALANGRTHGAVVGEREQVSLLSGVRLGVEVGPRPTDTGRGAGTTGRRRTFSLSECISQARTVAATIRPAGARVAAEVEAAAAALTAVAAVTRAATAATAATAAAAAAATAG